MIEDLKWNDSFTVNVVEMDDEHKELIEKMNHLYQLNRQLRTKNDLLFAFDSLNKYIEKHFHDEEQFLAQVTFPGLEEHKKLHEQLMQKMHGYREEFSKSPVAQIPSSLFDFFKLWIVSHILIIDKKYGDYFKNSFGE